MLQGNAKLVAGLIQKLGLHQPVIVGHSQGALVAMEVYRRHAYSFAPSTTCMLLAALQQQ